MKICPINLNTQSNGVNLDKTRVKQRARITKVDVTLTKTRADDICRSALS